MIPRQYLMRASTRQFRIGRNRWVHTNPSLFRNWLNNVIERINSNKYSELAAARFIDEATWSSYLNAFRRKMIKSSIDVFETPGPEKNLKDEIEHLRTSEIDLDKAAERMFNIIFPLAQQELKDIILNHKTLQQNSDLRAPHEWYPCTRLMKRNVIFHGGPTNSGKTYQAIKRLTEADPAKGGGMYCGPLRLLALEVYESLNKQGIITDLTTGQERRTIPGATHISSTVEMVNVDREFDVAVVDEIQMIADKDRGSSWTRVLLGLRARELHVCGGLEAEKIVRSLMETTGDNYTLQPYERLSKLVVEDESLQGDYSKVEPGDCIVAFSKQEIFSIKREIESKTKYKCAVIYGALPSETRSLQARLFNGENTGYDILVASDAIGMGLNLNIRRIIFHATKKFLGPIPCFVEPTLVKQIAGRAGRLSSNYKIGKVTAWQEVDLAYVRSVMAFDVPEISAAGIFPSSDVIEAFSQQLYQLGAEEAKHGIISSSSSNVQSTTSTSDAPKGDAKSTNDNNDSNNTSTSQSVQRDIRKEDKNLKSADDLDEIVDLALSAKSDDSTKYSNENQNNGRSGGTVKVEEELSAVLVDNTAATQGADNENDTYKDFKDDYPAEPVVLKQTEIRLSHVIQKFKDLSRIDTRYFLCESQGMNIIANWLHSIPLSMTERYLFSTAPVLVMSAFSMTALYEYAAKYALNQPVALNVTLSNNLPSSLEEFNMLCDRLAVLDLYEWLAIRAPKNFIERDSCKEQRKFALMQIDKTLELGALNASKHGELYAKTTNKLKGKLPAENFPHIREKFLENLARVPHHLHIVLPEQQPRDGQHTNKFGSKNSGNKYSQSSNTTKQGSHSFHSKNVPKHVKQTASTVL